MVYSGRITMLNNLRVSVRLPLIFLIAFSGLASVNSSSFAAETTAHAALANCVGQHLKPEDNETIVGVMMLLLADAEPPESSLHKALAPSREDVLSSTAKLMTRLGEQNCREELIADSPNEPGQRFIILFEQIMAHSDTSLKMAGARVGGVFALDLIKRLDPKVAADLVGSNGGRSTNSSMGVRPTPTNP